MLAKNLAYFAKADSAGIVLGARVPVVLTSRADSARARMASARWRHSMRMQGASMLQQFPRDRHGYDPRRQCRFLKRQIPDLFSRGRRKLRRLIKGQMDGIGSRPRLRASGADSDPLVDRAYPIESVPDVPAAMGIAGGWLRDELRISPMAVGHRVVHGGPGHDRPVLIDHGVVAGWSGSSRWPRFISRITWPRSGRPLAISVDLRKVFATGGVFRETGGTRNVARPRHELIRQLLYSQPTASCGGANGAHQRVCRNSCPPVGTAGKSPKGDRIGQVMRLMKAGQRDEPLQPGLRRRGRSARPVIVRTAHERRDDRRPSG